MVVVDRECSKPAESHQTLVTNCLQETLVLTQNTKKMTKTKRSFGKIAIDLDK